MGRPGFTPGPWEADELLGAIFDANGNPVMTAGTGALDDGDGWANACLIAAAPELYKALKAVEWVTQSNDEHQWLQCPGCYAVKEDGIGHVPGCELAAALAKAAPERGAR